MLVLCCDVLYLFFFFFKQKTAYEMRISDWSSDVCSSDLIEVEQPADGYCRSQGAGGTGSMEYLVMRAAQEFAYAYAGLVAGNRGHQQIFTRASQGLRHRNGRGENDSSRMEYRTVMQIGRAHV